MINSRISEDQLYTVSVGQSLTTEAGVFNIKQTGFPGWPEFKPPSPLTFIYGINEHGASSFYRIRATATTLTVSASGGNWNANAKGSVGFQNDFGTVSFSFTLTLELSF